MFLNPSSDPLILPALFLIALGFAIVLFVVGFVWLRRITRGLEDGDEHWRFRK
jgi:hypothetical protein